MVNLKLFPTRILSKIFRLSFKFIFLNFLSSAFRYQVKWVDRNEIQNANPNILQICIIRFGDSYCHTKGYREYCTALKLQFTVQFLVLKVERWYVIYRCLLSLSIITMNYIQPRR